MTRLFGSIGEASEDGLHKMKSPPLGLEGIGMASRNGCETSAATPKSAAPTLFLSDYPSPWKSGPYYGGGASHGVWALNGLAVGTDRPDVARLIAAAPVLLGALQKIASGSPDIAPPFRSMEREQMQALARAAIANAVGTSEPEGSGSSSVAAQVSQPIREDHTPITNTARDGRREP